MADRRRVTRRHGMALRASTIAKRLSWASLPAEIRLMILEAIAQQKHPGWASSAAVCREWQLCIEKRNFHQLRLRVSCLDDFERLVVRQRTLVRHLRLDIELLEYSCRLCKRQQSYSSWEQRNESIIGNGIWKLFRVLSSWKPASGSGLTLELSARSPSDSNHHSKNHYFASGDEGNHEDETSVQGTDCGRHGPQHGWNNGQQVTTPPPSAVRRLPGRPWMLVYFREELPQVGRVTCFVIRRQIRHWFSPRSLVLILNKLSCLETLIYEPWRQWQTDWRVLTDAVSIFEDFNDKRIKALVSGQPPWQSQVDTSRVVDSRIGAAFAARSLNLEELSLSYLANAEDFFRACIPTWTWPRLRSLALTSQLLRRPGRRQEIDALLYEVGVTALQMPRLRTLGVWDGIEGSTCAFIYHVDRDHASVTWRGTWDMALSPRVVEVWWLPHPCGKYGGKQRRARRENSLPGSR
ncbi:hypothetical protein C8A01DRAFT_19055 [Parachaetomium inaequale]|uniref:HTH Mu-type domain-containing protein n=1 Tax=Parachaetomium inaequale TaxID=2588326 RepID=A0AAN6PB39_9PEZI|nr:hypothetical protein C8A01DRAFT_19055 [Parachaetomium inaequale]